MLGGCMLCAWRASGRVSGRVAVAEQLCHALELTERELTLNCAALPELLRRLARATSEPISNFFTEAVSGIEKGKSFTDAWTSAADLSGLEPWTRCVLKPLSNILGSYDACGQSQAVARVRQELERRLPELREQARVCRRVYAALAAAAGGALILMLL